jgi:hypothetical protein
LWVAKFVTIHIPMVIFSAAGHGILLRYCVR